MLDSVLLSIAKTAILSKFDNTIEFDKEALFEKYPYLAQKGAVFVTLNQNSSLRGCIGSLVAHRELFDDIVHNAISAAFHDPRFTPLSEYDLKELQLEVSLLSEPKELSYIDFEDLKSKITPFRDGLILRHGQYQGTFLPQVWEQLPKVEQFLEHLAYKAGANPSIYAQHPQIFLYGVDKISEKFDAVPSL